jgi:hypothetical protein
MKVYRLNDCDWWAGESLQACADAYCAGVDLSPDEALDDPSELSDEEMQQSFFDEEAGETRTFSEQLGRMIDSGVKFPAFFASTEC